MITRDDIRSTYDTIRPYIRRTPVVQLDLADLDPAAGELPGVTLKLEQLQCAGSFKARGAFTNLLLRDVPAAGVVAGLCALVIGWWACTVTAQHLDQTDPSAIVWDEIVAFWLVLWLVMPASFAAQAAAFVLFRIFDAAKPGPVAWADQRFKGRRSAPIGWAQGFGILFDDFIAALCTLIVIALWQWL